MEYEPLERFNRTRKSFSILRPIFFLISFFLLIFLGFRMTGNNTSSSGSAVASRTADTPMIKADYSYLDSNWIYQKDHDAMRNEDRYSARTCSTGLLNFHFPYDGGVRAFIYLFKKGKSLDVCLEVEKGQFICHGWENCPISAKFDNGPVQTFNTVRAGDGSSNMIFIQPETKFIQMLRKSEKLTIEASFFQEGNRQMMFEVSGLNWK